MMIAPPSRLFNQTGTEENLGTNFSLISLSHLGHTVRPVFNGTLNLLEHWGHSIMVRFISIRPLFAFIYAPE